MGLDISLFLSFTEAIAWAKARGVVLPDDYYGNRIGIARAEAFSIAGLASLDQLEAVKQSLDAAIEKGVGYSAWIKQVEDGLIPLDLPAHRLDNIFRTNVQGAYTAGRWDSIQANKLDRPYLMYDAVNDTRTRPAHRAMDNIIKPVGDPFWKTHYPPNGYRCRCSVISLTETQAKKRGGVTADDDVPDNAKPDKGWDYNGGEARGEGIKRALAQKLERCKKLGFGVDSGSCNKNSASLLADIAAKLATIDVMKNKNAEAVKGQETWQSMKLKDLRVLKKDYDTPSPIIDHSAADKEQAVDIIRNAIGIKDGKSVSVTTPIGTVIIIDDLIPHIVEKREDARERYANFIIPTLTNPLEIWKVEYDDGSFRYRFVKLFDSKYEIMIIANVRYDGVILWNIMQRETKNMNKLRVGELIHSEYEK